MKYSYFYVGIWMLAVAAGSAVGYGQIRLELAVGQATEVSFEVSCPVKNVRAASESVEVTVLQHEDDLKFTLNIKLLSPVDGEALVVGETPAEPAYPLVVISSPRLDISPPDPVSLGDVQVAESAGATRYKVSYANYPGTQFSFSVIERMTQGSALYRGVGIEISSLVLGRMTWENACFMMAEGLEAARQFQFGFLEFADARHDPATKCALAKGESLETTLAGRAVARLAERLGKKMVLGSSYRVREGLMGGNRYGLEVAQSSMTLEAINALSAPELRDLILYWPASANNPRHYLLLPNSPYKEVGSLVNENAGHVLQRVSGVPGAWIVQEIAPTRGVAIENYRTMGGFMTFEQFMAIDVATAPDRAEQDTMFDRRFGIFAKYAVGYNPLDKRLYMVVSPVLRSVTMEVGFHAQCMEVIRLQGYVPVVAGWISKCDERGPDGRVISTVQMDPGSVGMGQWLMQNNAPDDFPQKTRAVVEAFLAQERRENTTIFFPHRPGT